MKKILIFCLLFPCILFAQGNIVLDKKDEVKKVWSSGDDIYIHVEPKRFLNPSEEYEQQGIFEAGEKLRFYKLSSDNEVKEISFSAYRGYLSNYGMLKMFYYFDDYVLLFIEQNVLLFDLKNEKQIEIIKKTEDLNATVPCVNAFYEKDKNQIRFFIARTTILEYTLDLATFKAELVSEHKPVLSTIKKIIAYNDGMLMVRYKQNDASGWAVIDLENDQPAGVSFPDKFDRFTTTRTFQVPGTPIVYFRIIGITSVTFNKDKSFIYMIDMLNMTMSKVGEDNGYLWGAEIMLDDKLLINNHPLGAEPMSSAYFLNDGKMIASQELSLNDVFYYEGDFYCYQGVRKSTSGKPSLYKLDNNSWTFVKSFDAKQKVDMEIFLIRDSAGKAGSLFKISNKTDFTLTSTPPVF